MNIQAEKLEILKLLLDTNNTEILKAVKSILKSKDKSLTETEYLLSTEANKKNLLESIEQAKEGKVKKFSRADILN